MGSSFVSIDHEHGFWMLDGFLEIWLRLLALHIKDPTEPGSVATKIRDQWLLASRGYFSGCVPVSMDEAVATDEGKSIVKNAIHSLLHSLEHGPEMINNDALNLLGIEGVRFGSDIEKRRLIEIGNAFLDLIDGKITGTASDTSFVPGCT
ncbi:MAG TPA: hypothetical protein VN541_02890 [Tepidisphaeraceae bacterium]|nr:hypothetical protein [Tepidisphaeraceae bacterium]